MVSKARPRARRRAGGAPPRRGEAGYNLVILVVAITVMNVMVAAAIPLWRTAIRRDKEEELIFRGWQYAEAIRVFQHRYGRLPVRLEELVEVKPRCIRQLWADPMTGKRDWVPIRVGAPGGVDLNPPPGGGDGGKEPGEDGRPPAASNPPDGSVGLGPIRGVRSRSKEKSIKRLFDQERYDRWQFTVELLAQGARSVLGGEPVVQSPHTPARWLGRPFRPGINPAGALPPPGGEAPPPPGEKPPPPPDDGEKPPPEDGR
jgi:type II secretory pathway pseudopilin PulG